MAAVLAAGAAVGIVPDSPRPQSFLWPLYAWDFDLYDYVARHGYRHGETPEFAFFPLWPLLLRASGPLPDWVAGGAGALVASFLAFLGIARASPAADARRVAIALACLPGSFALALAYPDGLALAAAAWACVLVAADRPIPAAAVACVAAVARPAAFVVAAPLAALAPRRWSKLAALAPLVATAAVHLYFWHRYGRPDAFLRAQRMWGRAGVEHWLSGASWRALLLLAAVALGTLAVVALRRLGRPLAVGAVLYATAGIVLLALAGSTQTRIEVVRAVVVTFPLLAALWLLPAGYRPWAVFATLVVALPLLSGSVQSLGRQTLFAFPLVWAAAYGPVVPRRRVVVAGAIAGNAALLLLLPRYAP